MKYAIYHLHFSAGVHFGNGALWDGESTLRADTFFSALCQEAAAQAGPAGIEALVDAVRTGALRVSDLFPFVGEELYLPKPLYPIQGQPESDSSVKKLFKKLKYIPLSGWDSYCQGNLNPQDALEKLDTLGSFSMRTMSALRAPEKLTDGAALPYHVGVYQFRPGNGLYVLAGFHDSEHERTFEQFLDMLSYSGIGGKRSAGFGRFTVEKCSVPLSLQNRLTCCAGRTNMSLSVCMPAPEELEKALDGAYYLLLKRSGFIASPDFAPEQRKKKDFFSFCAGSCFATPFTGDVFDVGSGGTHPVYRYAVPLWMEM